MSSDPNHDAILVVAAELRLAGQIKLFEAAMVMRDNVDAESIRAAAHEQLDLLLDAKSAAFAKAWQDIERRQK